MDNMKNLNDLVNQIKNVESGVQNMIVPLLKDTIADTNKHNRRLFILCIISLVAMFALGIYSQFLVAKQNEKYTEFLSQFEFGTEEIYQDLDATDGGDAIINSGISVIE
jgi:hypothetical protein